MKSGRKQNERSMRSMKQANKPIRAGSRKKAGPQTPKQKGKKGKRVSFVSLSAFESGSENMGWSWDELEGWESEDDIVSLGRQVPSYPPLRWLHQPLHVQIYPIYPLPLPLGLREPCLSPQGVL